MGEKSETSCGSVSSTEFMRFCWSAEVEGDVNVDPFTIEQAIVGAAKTAEKRSGFVKGAMEKAFFESGQ